MYDRRMGESESTSTSAGQPPRARPNGDDGRAHQPSSPAAASGPDPDQDPVGALTDSLAATIEDALRDDETEGMTLPDLAHHVAERIVDAGRVVHLSVCGECGLADAVHKLDCGSMFDPDMISMMAFVGSIS